MPTVFRASMRATPSGTGRVAAHLHRRLTIPPLWVVGILLVLSLAGHDAAMGAVSHNAFATGALASTPAAPGAHAAGRHHPHAPQPAATKTGLPSPASEPCLTSRTEVIPSGTDCPDRAVAAAAAIRVPYASQPRETAPEPVPPPRARVRRALLQVYLN